MMRPACRILRVITRLNVGGPTRHVALLMEGLDPDRFEQVLVTGTAEDHEGEGLLAVAGKRLRVPGLRRAINPMRDLQARRGLERIIREHRPDIVHTHQGKAGALGRLAAARAGVPAICHTYHGHTFSGYFGPLRGRLVRQVERRAAAVSQVLVCQSPSQQADVLRHLGPVAVGKTRVIAPAISPRFCEPPPGGRARLRRELDVPDRMTVLLLPARLVPIKRPDAAIGLLRALLEDRDAELWLAGEGPLRAELAELARQLGITHRVRFLGYRDDLVDLYAAADLIVLTSRLEGTPLALLEAMAVGTPVASTAVGGVEDIAGEVGLLLDPRVGPDTWARKVAGFLGDEASLARRVARGRELVQERHRPERLARDITTLYEELMDEQRA